MQCVAAHPRTFCLTMCLDVAVAVQRLSAQPERPLVAALLDQRNLAGLGFDLTACASTEEALRGADIVTTVTVETPVGIDGTQADLLRQLAALRGEENPTLDVETRHKGVFNRFKDALGGR